MNALVAPITAATAAEPFNVYAESTMLARLTVRQWTARKLDRAVTNKVTADHGAAADAGRFNKLLVPAEALAEIEKAANKARGVHYARTLPWAEDGARILSSKGYFAYTAELRALKDEFADAVAKFCERYREHVDKRRGELGAMFRESDYPGVNEIRGRFSFDIAIFPLPVAADFRVTLAQEQAAIIRADIEARTNAAIRDATRDAWARVAEHVGKMAEKLRAYKSADETGDKPEGIFRDSLVGNVRELAEILPSLNISNDPAMDAIARRMLAELCADDAKALRQNETARKSVADAAEDILADVQGYLA